MKNNSRYAHLTKDEAMKAIIADYGMTEQALTEIFREGWLRGEEYGTNCK